MGMGMGALWRAAWRTVWRTFAIFFEINGDQRAASFAFYAFFSLFPLILLTVTVGSKFLAPEVITGTVIEYVDSVIPLNPEDAGEVFRIIEGIMQSRTGLGIAALLGILWASSHFFLSLVRAVNRAWHTVELDWWKVPLKNLAMIGIFGSALGVGILVPVIVSTLENFRFFDPGFLPGVLNVVRYLLPSLVLFYGLLILYKLSPRRRTLFREVWVAALLVTVALKLLQQLLLFYTNNVWHVNAIYGAMGILVVLLLWVYLCGMLIILGGCLCAAMHPESENAREAGVEKSI